MDFQWIGENFCTYPANRCYVQSFWTPQKCLRRTHFPETADPSAPGVRVHRVTSVQSHDLYHTVKLNTSVLHEKGRFVPFRIPSCTEGNSYRHFGTNPYFAAVHGICYRNRGNATGIIAGLDLLLEQ